MSKAIENDSNREVGIGWPRCRRHPDHISQGLFFAIFLARDVGGDNDKDVSDRE